MKPRSSGGSSRCGSSGGGGARSSVGKGVWGLGFEMRKPNDQRVFMVVVVVLWGNGGGSANSAKNAISG